MTVDVPALRRTARGLLSADTYYFYSGGSGAERTLAANRRSWREVWLAPRVLRDVSAVETSVELLGARLRTPVGVAPTALHRLAHPDGELASAAAAARAGALYVLSTRSSCLIEDVARVVQGEGGSWWFQVYVMADRDLTVGLVERAAAAGAGALVLTMDTPVVGRKKRTSRIPMSLEHLAVNLGKLASTAAAEQRADLTAADITWLRDVGGGLPVVVKGILRPDDAAACVRAGASAVWASNHGGRQLDGAIPAAWALPGIVAELAGHQSAAAAAADTPVDTYADGGIATGADVLAALALGARATFVGRPVLWALACGGADGVQELLAGLTDELAHAMTLAGARTVAETAGLAVAGR